MKTRRSAQKRPLKLTAIALALSALLVSCGGGDSGGGGIIGTGKTLEGTVPTNRAFASNDITLKAMSGERSTTSIAANGRFSAESLSGTGPYLMRVDLGNDNAYYSVAHLGDDSTVQNVHAYTDVAIRNWFATQGLDIDKAFTDEGTIDQLPTAAEIAVINGIFRDQVAGALASYDLGSTDLQSVVFNADDTGVDEFLDRNPILISDVNGDVSITIIIQDPTTDTQSTVVQDLPMDTDLTANDTIPPSAPTGLRVLPSASNEIVLAWESASDNIGVTGYEVIRDGEVIATTPYPVYIDSPLDSEVEYTYTIIALDSTGNRSLASASGSSETLAAPDTVAPPAPTSLQLVSSATSIDVRWVQSEIADVANFTVLRSVEGAMLDPRASVTSTQIIDAGLNSGTNYCYQVIANDASQNASGPSDTACAVTGGSNIINDAPTPVVTPPSTDTDTDADTDTETGGNNAHLVAMDVSSMACSTELDTTLLTGEARITAGCYLVERTISLSDTNLTIDAGVVLKFASDTTLRISSDSSLTANGTQALPIVLTGQQATAGYWDGLNYSRSNNVKNSLEHVVIEYAGDAGDSSGALYSTASSTQTTRLQMANVLIRNSSSFGFYLQEGTLLDRFDSITSTQNESPGYVSAHIAGMFGTGMSMSGNTTDTLVLSTESIDNAVTLADIGIPYNTGSIRVDAPLEIEAGVTIAFDAAGRLYVGQDGSLRVAGTEAEPVLLTATQMTPGYWQGVHFVFSNSTNNELQNLIIEYAGSGSAAGSISTNSSDGLPVVLKMNSVTLRSSSSNGFNFAEGTSLTEFSNIVSTQNEESGLIQPEQLVSFGSGIDLSGNTFDRLTLDSGDIETVQSWPLQNVAVRFGNLSVEAALTLPAGQEFIAMPGAEIRVDRDGGSLTAIGTAAAPIIFRGEQPTAGFWDGIYFVFSNSPLNTLDHVQISDGGSGNPEDSGNIEMNCPSSGLPGNLSLSNAVISNSAGWGVLADGDGCTLNLGSNVTYSNNMQGDISN